MRKTTLVLAAMTLAFGLTACGKEDDKTTTAAGTTQTVEATTQAPATTEEATTEEATTEEATTEEATTEETTVEETEETTPSQSVMTYDEYMKAEDDDPVCIEAYVQAKQSWRNDKATIYTQDEDGAYFIYEMVCSEEDYAKLTVGTKIRVTGFKTTWSGEVEIASGATFEIIEGNYVAEAKDVTDYLGTDELVNFQNQFVSFKGMTVAASTDKDGNETAYLYKWDGSGAEGDDLYFMVSLGDATYQFTVESYLCGADTDVYKAVKELKVGDVIDMEGFLYWYNGVNPHITSVSVVTAE